MWEVKRFKTIERQRKWIADNSARYQINVIFINNGYAVEYRKLRVINIK